VSEKILDPVVLIRSELLRKRSSDTVNTPVKTLTFTVFCAVVPSKTSPVATGAFTPSESDSVAPFVYDESLSSRIDNTRVVDEKT